MRPSPIWFKWPKVYVDLNMEGLTIGRHTLITMFPHLCRQLQHIHVSSRKPTSLDLQLRPQRILEYRALRPERQNQCAGSCESSQDSTCRLFLHHGCCLQHPCRQSLQCHSLINNMERWGCWRKASCLKSGTNYCLRLPQVQKVER